MPKQVRFNPRVQVRQNGEDLKSVDLTGPKVDLSQQSTSPAPPSSSPNQMTTLTTLGSVIGIILFLAIVATWIAGLVKMAMCGGTHTGYFWATLLLFFLVPGPGTLASTIMAIVALALLRPGKSVLGMCCPISKK